MTDGLNAIAERLFAALLVWSWQGLVLLTCAWLVLKVARFKSPGQRYQIWLLSLVALALLPLASPLVQSLPAVRPSNSALSFAIEGPRKMVNLVSAPTTITSIPAPATKEPFGSSVLKLVRPVLFMVWLTGALIVLTRLIKGQTSLWLMLKRARPISSIEVDLPMSDPTIRLRISNEIDSPLLCGIFRPIVILPADIGEWTSSWERQAMVQHELAHIERLDPLANVIQNGLKIVFFFHPLFRHASNQLNLERELACDQLVLARGACAETYAEGLFKAAERSLMGARHQLAFFSTRKAFERRIEMIFREQTHAHTWKFVILSTVAIATVAWFLIPAGSSVTGQSQPSIQPQAKLNMVKEMGERKAFAELIEMALHNPDPELRRLAAVRLTELEGDGSTDAMFELYRKTDDVQVKIILVDTLARISEIEPLVKIALSTQDPEEKQQLLRRIKWLRENSESNDVRNFDVSLLAGELSQVKGEPPPPPPPPPAPGKSRMPPPPPPKPKN